MKYETITLHGSEDFYEFIEEGYNPWRYCFPHEKIIRRNTSVTELSMFLTII